MTCLSATASTRQSTSASPGGPRRESGDGVRSSRQGSRQRLCRPRFFAGARPPAGGHRKGWRPKRGDQALGRSRGGLTTKIHMATDGRGRPLRIILTPGQRGDVTQAPALLEGLEARRVLADKAYDSNALRQVISSLGAEAVIPCNPTRKHLIPYDFDAYKARNLIERCFNKLKHFRRIATRYDRRAVNFLSFIHLAAALIWMR
nr:IS5 family transposase [Rhizobium leguminosarum]